MGLRGPKKNTYIHKIAESTVKWKKRKDGDPMMVGYARVSTQDQNNQRQIDELVRFGVAPEDIFQDKESGKTMNRKAWQACFRDLQEGDLLVVLPLDRLGRSLRDLIDIEQKLFEKGVKLKVIQQPIDTSTAAGRMQFHMIGAVAEWERAWNAERSTHGLSMACERGVIGGQPAKHTDEQIKEALKKTGGNVTKAAKILKCAKVTIIRRKQMWKDGKKLIHAVKPKRKARA